jgi:hypothetical protein
MITFSRFTSLSYGLALIGSGYFNTQEVLLYLWPLRSDFFGFILSIIGLLKSS